MSSSFRFCNSFIKIEVMLGKVANRHVKGDENVLKIFRGSI